MRCAYPAPGGSNPALEARFASVTVLDLPVNPPVRPMLAKLAHALPPAGDFLYEPKWDGFRGIVFRDGDEIEIGSRYERPLTSCFTELVEDMRDALPPR